MTKKQFCAFVLLFLGSVINTSGKELSTEHAGAYQKVCIGVIEKDERALVYQGNYYPLYVLMNTAYISLADLEDMGAVLMDKDTYKALDFTCVKPGSKPSKMVFQDTKAYLHNKILYIGSLRTYCIEVDKYLFVPVEALSYIFNMKLCEKMYLAEKKWSDLNHYIEMDETYIINNSPYMLRADFLHIYWDGKKFIDCSENEVLIEPYQRLHKKLKNLDSSLTYVTTVIRAVNDMEIPLDLESCYGQKNHLIFERYTYELKKERLDKLFPEYRVNGTMKYDVGPYKKDQKVKVWRAEKRQYFMTIGTEGRQIMLPYSSIAVEPDKGVLYKPVSAEDIEDYVSINGLTSETDYIVWTDVYRQRVYILKRSKNQWRLQKTFKCSSGKNIHLTPSGIYKILYTLPYFGLDRNFRCKNAVVFYRDYMFHSILFDSSGKYIKEGKYQLGYRVSHGCVRLSEEDSSWIYKYVPLKTTVWIR